MGLKFELRSFELVVQACNHCALHLSCFEWFCETNQGLNNRMDTKFEFGGTSCQR